MKFFCSVADPEPDPYVFGPPGSISTRFGSGSGSFCHQAKIVRKTLVPKCFVTSICLFIFENVVYVASKSNKQKKKFSCHLEGP